MCLALWLTFPCAQSSQLSSEPVVTPCLQVCQVSAGRGRQRDSPWVQVAEAAGLLLPPDNTTRNLVLDKLRGKFNKYMAPIFGWTPGAATQVCARAVRTQQLARACRTLAASHPKHGSLLPLSHGQAVGCHLLGCCMQAAAHALALQVTLQEGDAPLPAGAGQQPAVGSLLVMPQQQVEDVPGNERSTQGDLDKLMQAPSATYACACSQENTLLPLAHCLFSAGHEGDPWLQRCMAVLQQPPAPPLSAQPPQQQQQSQVNSHQELVQVQPYSHQLQETQVPPLQVRIHLAAQWILGCNTPELVCLLLAGTCCCWRWPLGSWGSAPQP
jgi:hypothetical protein